MSLDDTTYTLTYDEHGFYDGQDDDNFPWTCHREQNLDEHADDLMRVWREDEFIVSLTYWPTDQGFRDTRECYDFIYRGSDGKLHLLDISENMGVNDLMALNERAEHLLDFLLSRINGQELLLPVQIAWGKQRQENDSYHVSNNSE